MFRRFQFTSPKGAIFISCVDQKLWTLQEMMVSFYSNYGAKEKNLSAYVAHYLWPKIEVLHELQNSVLSLVVGRSEINKTTKISLDKMLNIKKTCTADIL